MKQYEKIMNRYSQKLQDAEQNVANATERRDLVKEKMGLASRVIGNIRYVKRLSDLGIRKWSLPQVVIEGEFKKKLRSLLTQLGEKHDSVYHVDFMGEMGSARVLGLKEGHSEEEFDYGVYDVLDAWKHLYFFRKLDEQTYNLIMEGSFDTIYSKMVGEVERSQQFLKDYGL